MPLSRSAWRGDSKIVDLLINLGAKIDYAGPTNVTPLMWASKRGHDKLILKMIKEYKANTELTTEYGKKYIIYKGLIYLTLRLPMVAIIQLY